MINIQYKGRLGNNLIQYAAAYILTKRSGLTLNTLPEVSYSNEGRKKTSYSDAIKTSIDFGSVFNIQPSLGQSYSKTIELDDTNYYKHLNNPLKDTGYQLNGFFQDGRLLCDYRSDILDLYQYKTQPKIEISQDDAFFACRFGDCLLNPRTYCSIEYIESQLTANLHNYRNIYLTSDTLDHPPLVEFIEKYNIIPYNNDPLKTILFAKNFNNLVLSAGSFSYWIAYLSEATNVTVFNNQTQDLMVDQTKRDPLQLQNAWNYKKNVKFSL